MKVTISERKRDGSMTRVVIDGVVTDTEGEGVDEMIVRAEAAFNKGGMEEYNGSINGIYRLWIEER